MRLPITLVLSCIFPIAATDAQVPARGPMQDAINNLLSPIHWSAVETFDVAGVRLGMTPAEARAALVAKGFTPRAVDPTQASWAARVSEKVVERRGGKPDASTVTMFTMAKGKQDERIEVWYAATPTGAKVASVSYVIPSNRMTAAAFFDGVGAKYGKPAVERGKTRVYCVRGRDSRTTCDEFNDVVSRPGLVASSEFALHSIKLMEGGDPADARKQRLAAEVEAKAPKDAKATF